MQKNRQKNDKKNSGLKQTKLVSKPPAIVKTRDGKPKKRVNKKNDSSDDSIFNGGDNSSQDQSNQY